MTATSTDTINVLYAIAEADPLVKIGGLGDVAGSLPYALKSLDPEYKIDIRICIPFHPQIRPKVKDPQLVSEFLVRHQDGSIPGKAYKTQLNGVTVYLIDGKPIHDSHSVYSSDNFEDGHKYCFFSQAVLEFAHTLDWRPDIYHANDWHTAPLIYAVAIRKKYDPFFESCKTLLSIHNLPFMGAGAEDALKKFLLPPCMDKRLPDWACELPLPLGLVSADHINTVSPTYGQEILTPEFGCGLESFLESRKDTVSGILNGLDTEIWDPSKDQKISANFDAEDTASREENKTVLRKMFSLSQEPDLPLLILISRMDQQKGVDIAIDGLRKMADQPWQAIILGTGNPKIEQSCKELEDDLPDKVRSAIRFDAGLARQMYAGGDMILMPSRYEPCGLAQMIAMRYGCVPIARATGGLSDSIIDTQKAEHNTGFLFKKPTPKAFSKALSRALETYHNKENWKIYQLNGMKQNFSWEKSALKYAKLYIELMEV